MKTKLTSLVSEQTDLLTLQTLLEEHVPDSEVTGKGKNTWVTEYGVRIIKEKLEVPEIIPNYYVGQVTHDAPNPNYVYAFVDELGKRVPVIIPRKYHSRLMKKKIKIEEITDEKGSSYRYIPTRYDT